MTSSAYDNIRSTALRRIEMDRLDPVVDRVEIAAAIDTAVADYQRVALGSDAAQPLRDPREMSHRVLRSVTDHGPLTELFARERVEEIFIEGDVVTYIDEDGRLMTLAEPTSARENRQVVARLLAETDRRLDAAHPIVQARVLDGTARLTAVVPPVAETISATMRRYAMRRETLNDLVEVGSLSSPAAALLDAAMRADASVVVSGPPGAGKTTLMAALLAAVPQGLCVRSVEEVRELHVPLGPTSAFYEAVPPGPERAGVSMRELVRLVLAMRPDRIVVGEVRGGEAYELTRAGNAGCGFSCTVHANSARDALHALVNAALMAGENVTEPVVRNVFATSIDLVVHLGRDPVASPGGRLRRQVLEILAVAPSLGTGFTTEPIFVREHLGARLRWTGQLPPQQLSDRLARTVAKGVDLSALLAGEAAA